MANHVKYPWDKWLNPENTKPVKIIKGRDYNIMTHSMISYIRANSSRRGMRVSLFVDDKGNITITPNGAAAPKKPTLSTRKPKRQPKKKIESQQPIEEPQNE